MAEKGDTNNLAEAIYDFVDRHEKQRLRRHAKRGRLGEGVIHVHHLRELASLGKEYEVDPIKDLRPVCPNCHAIPHTSSPAMTIEKLRSVLFGRKPIRWPGKS